MKTLLVLLFSILPLFAQRFPPGALVSSKPAEAGGGGGGEPTEVANDNFSSYSAFTDLDAAANWEMEQGAFTTLGMDTVVNGAGGSIQLYRYTAASFNSDQYSECILSATATFEQIGIAVRVQDSQNGYFLHYNESGTALNIGYISGGTKTVSSTITKDYSAGVRLLLRCSGAGTAARLDAYEDTGGGYVQVFTSVNPAVDIDNGRPGLSGDGSGTTMAITYWAGGNW